MGGNWDWFKDEERKHKLRCTLQHTFNQKCTHGAFQGFDIDGEVCLDGFFTKEDLIIMLTLLTEYNDELKKI